MKTSDNQFGFKKGVGCSFAIKTVRNVVDMFNKQGSTAHLCALDITKAFDKVKSLWFARKTNAEAPTFRIVHPAGQLAVWLLLMHQVE